MPTEELLQAFEVGRDQYVITGLAYRARLDPDTNIFRMQVAAVGSQVWNDWLTVDAAGNVTISSLAIGVAWASITGTPTTLAGYGITDAQPLATILTTLAALANAAGTLTNDGAGGLSWNAVSTAAALAARIALHT